MSWPHSFQPRRRLYYQPLLGGGGARRQFCVRAEWMTQLVLVQGPAVSFFPGLGGGLVLKFRIERSKQLGSWGHHLESCPEMNKWEWDCFQPLRCWGCLLLWRHLPVLTNGAAIPGRAQRASSDEWRPQLACSPFVSQMARAVLNTDEQVQPLASGLIWSHWETCGGTSDLPVSTVQGRCVVNPLGGCCVRKDAVPQFYLAWLQGPQHILLSSGSSQVGSGLCGETWWSPLTSVRAELAAVGSELAFLESDISLAYWSERETSMGRQAPPTPTPETPHRNYCTAAKELIPFRRDRMRKDPILLLLCLFGAMF